MDFADRASSEGSEKDPSLVFDALMRVSQTLRLRFNDWLARFELNDGRYAVLKSLISASDGGCSQAELAEQLGQSESNVSTLIERMQRDGLVNRSRSEADRRKRVLLISPSGRMTLARVETNQSAWAARAMKSISARDRSTLLGLLEQLGKGLAAPGTDSKDVAKIRKSPGLDSQGRGGHRDDPIDDPRSPQFALHQMLLALSVHAGTDSIEKDAA